MGRRPRPRRARHLTRAEFEGLVDEALASVPERFKTFLANTAVVVEDEPSAEVRAEMELAPDETLYGLYEGVPLTERTTADDTIPDRVVIYRTPLVEEFADDRAAIRREIRITVLHEIGHHFGLDEDDLGEEYA
jgi:predicted Zn-dependent protease with MMP-like domain